MANEQGNDDQVSGPSASSSPPPPPPPDPGKESWRGGHPPKGLGSR